MMLLTSVVLFTGIWTMWEFENRVKEFFALMFLLVAGVYGVFMSMDLFWIFVWYDVSLFPMYPLIAIWGGTRKEYGAMKLTLYFLAGSALILPAIIYLWVQGGAHTFDLFELQRIGFSAFDQKLTFIMLYLGFGILAAVWPFHTWSPVGHVAAPTAVSMIHAGVLMKLGAYGILRIGDDAVSCRCAVLVESYGSSGLYRDSLRGVGRSGADRFEICDRLLQCVSHGSCRAGACDFVGKRHKRGCFPDVCPRSHDGPFLFFCRLYLRPHAYEDHSRTGRIVQNHAGCFFLFHSRGIGRYRRSSDGEFLGGIACFHRGCQGFPGRWYRWRLSG